MTPWNPSITCGPEAPSPITKRPLETNVQASRRHGGQRRGTGVDLKDSRSEFDGRRLGRQVNELADGVEGIRLRDEGDVEARLLQVTDLFDGFGEPAAVVQTHTDTHVVTPILTIAAVCDAHTSSGTPIEHLTHIEHYGT